jgi:peptide deformylase
MAVRAIRVMGDPVLRTPCAPITTIDHTVRALVADLMDTVDDEGRAGLSANQIGVGLRAFAWRVDGELGYVLNPRLVTRSAGTQDGPEGCLSVPELWFPTPRAHDARVVGIDLDGRTVVVEGAGLMARCLQHETDHLDGLLYLDRLVGPTRRDAMRAVRSSLTPDDLPHPPGRLSGFATGLRP